MVVTTPFDLWIDPLQQSVASLNKSAQALYDSYPFAINMNDWIDMIKDKLDNDMLMYSAVSQQWWSSCTSYWSHMCHDAAEYLEVSDSLQDIRRIDVINWLIELDQGPYIELSWLDQLQNLWHQHSPSLLQQWSVIWRGPDIELSQTGLVLDRLANPALLRWNGPRATRWSPLSYFWKNTFNWHGTVFIIFSYKITDILRQLLNGYNWVYLLSIID